MLKEQIRQIREITDFVPEIAVVLGSGLGDFENMIEKVCEISYADIEGMPVSTAPSHSGKFIFGKVGGKNIVAMSGRVHFYEGYSAKQIAIPVRIMKLLGAKHLILTNAAGGINKNLNAGDFMLISDHISCFIDSPLIGKNIDALGTRFPDMSNAYDKDLRALIKKTALENSISIKEGVYCALKGPQFETAAEIKMLSNMGADAVGMSTVCETIAAVHAGFKVCAISLITNLACGVLDKALSGEEVIETANRVSSDFNKLISEIIRNI